MNDNDTTPQQGEALAIYGDAVKALGAGKVGGYLVRFSTAADPDITIDRDYFEPATDFAIEDGAATPIYYEHGLDPVLKTRKIGAGTMRKDDVGIWVEAQLKLRDDYERHIYKLAEAGKLGWSSGTAAHLVERERTGQAHRIKHWPLGLDASLTPTPAEPRNAAMTLKSLPTPDAEQPQVEPTEGGEPSAQTAQPAADSLTPSTPTPTPSQQETQQVEETQNAGQPVDVAAIATEAASAAVKAYRQQLEAEPAFKAAGFIVPGAEATSEQREDAAVKNWGAYIRRGVKAAMQENTNSEGGYLVPVRYSNEVVVGLKDASILRIAGANVLPVEGTNSFKVPSLTNSGAAVLTSEEASFDQGEPTTGEITFAPYKYTRLSKVSDELLADSRVDVMGQVLVPDAVQSFSAAENTAFTTGTGSNQPQGIVTGATVGVTAASTTAITGDEIIALYHSLGYLYRQNAVWMMNDATVKLIRTLKDSDGQYIWQSGLQGGQPDRLLGRPVFTNNAMATGAANAKTVLFGDLRYFRIVDFAGLAMKRLEELYAASGQVGFRWFKRVDSRVMLAEAIQVLRQAAA